VDVPGIPVTVIFTAGCNYDCPYCQNAELIPLDSGEEVDIEEIVHRSTGHLSQGHCITGGEPTLQKDLPELLKALKSSGSKHINLNTNGSVPSLLEKCLPYLDSIWLDVKITPPKYKSITRTKSDTWKSIEKSIKLILQTNVQLWPRTTYAGGLMTPKDIEYIAFLLKDLRFEGTYLVQNYIESTGVRETEREHIHQPKECDLHYLTELDIPNITIKLEWR
jgi:pyruvate formate lyase activating enzyme